MSGVREPTYTQGQEEAYAKQGLTPGMTTTGTTTSGEGMGDKISRKAGETWQGIKEHTPGTAEYKTTHGEAGTGIGSGTDTGTYTGVGNTGAAYTGMGATTTSASDHVDMASTRGVPTTTTAGGAAGSGESTGDKMARKAGETWERVKETTPGTKEHKATHATQPDTETGRHRVY